MKRYKKLTDTIHYMKNPESIFMEQMEVDNKMVEHPYGEWVKYKDVEGMVEGQVLESIELKCNCGEKLRDQRNWWICPAHGYKKR